MHVFLILGVIILINLIWDLINVCFLVIVHIIKVISVSDQIEEFILLIQSVLMKSIFAMSHCFALHLLLLHLLCPLYFLAPSSPYQTIIILALPHNLLLHLLLVFQPQILKLKFPYHMSQLTFPYQPLKLYLILPLHLLHIKLTLLPLKTSILSSPLPLILLQTLIL